MRCLPVLWPAVIQPAGPAGEAEDGVEGALHAVERLLCRQQGQCQGSQHPGPPCCPTAHKMAADLAQKTKIESSGATDHEIHLSSEAQSYFRGRGPSRHPWKQAWLPSAGVVKITAGGALGLRLQQPQLSSHGEAKDPVLTSLLAPPVTLESTCPCSQTARLRHRGRSHLPKERRLARGGQLLAEATGCLQQHPCTAAPHPARDVCR